VLRIEGPETIGKLIDLPRIKTFNFSREDQAVYERFLERGLAFVPYCRKCGVPVNWIFNHPKILYECPKCKAIWRKNTHWGEDMIKDRKEKEEK